MYSSRMLSRQMWRSLVNHTSQSMRKPVKSELCFHRLTFNSSLLMSFSKRTKRTLTFNTISYQWRIGNKVLILSNTHRYFHCSPRRQALPLIGPLLLKLASPVSRISAVLLGRQVRKWWRALPDKQKRIYFHSARSRTDKIIIVVFSTVGLCFAYYNYHLEENDLTGRKQLMIMNDHQIKEIAEKEFIALSEELKESFLPPNHPSYKRVVKIAKRILNSNICPEVLNKSWEINVVESETVNAFVLPNGEIFVMTGMLEAAENDDELAGVLGHEIAHVLLKHPAEQLSFSGFVSIFNLIVVTLLWSIVPSDVIAVFLNLIESKLQDILIHLPYQRDLEREADCIGLYLAARACFDVRKISNFWKRMDKLEENQSPMEWLSTHPSHSRRANWIDDQMSQALEMRRSNNCPEMIPFFERVKHVLGL